MRYSLLAALLYVAACAAPRSLVLSADYTPEATETRTPHECQYVVRSVGDMRSDKESLGRIGLSDVSSEDIVEWVRNAFMHRGFQAGNETIPGRPNYAFDVSVKLAYVRSSSSSKATNIVLGVQRDEDEEITYYRGSDASINWSSSVAEVQRSFNIALTKAIKLVENDLAKICRD